jgi:hypothetical protein
MAAAPLPVLATESPADEAAEPWTRTKKAWAFAIGLATVIGGIAAILALFVH